MSSVKECRKPRKMGAGVAGAIRSRQEKNNLSELGVNWIGNGQLNASESDLMYKYHVAHLSNVYWGKSKVNNNTPRSVANPPPWANLDPRVLSPIPDKKTREARWDGRLSLGNCLQSTETRGSSIPTNVRKRPASAGVRRRHQEPPSTSSSARSKNGSVGAKQLQGGVKNRPSSANVRGRDAAGGNLGASNTTRGSDTTAQRGSGAYGSSGYHERGCFSRCNGRKISGGDYGRNDHGKSCGTFSTEERDILAGGYRLNESQETTFREFVAMLVDFDACSTVHILDDVFREAQLATGLQDFTGCGEY